MPLDEAPGQQVTMFETAAAWMVLMLFASGIWLIAGAVIGGGPTSGSKR